MIAKLGAFYDWQAGRAISPKEMISAIEERRGTFSKAGIVAGERVLLPTENRAEFFASLLALWSLGASAVPLDARLTDAETESLKRSSGAARALPPGFESAGTSLALTSWPAPSGREALVLFTTGTLSAPRGVILSSRAVANKIAVLGEKLPLRDMERTLCLLPVSFGHGLLGNSLAPWLNGMELTSAPPLDVPGAQAFPEILRERKITFFSSVPGVWALLRRMIEPPFEHGVRRIFCASAPLGGNIFRIVAELFPGVPLHNVYGLTEMASWIAMSGEMRAFTAGHIGFPFDGEMKLEGGEVFVRGESRMTGYLGEAPLREGDWFKTMDLASFDPGAGYVLQGRSGHLVNRGGVKVQLEEIEAILTTHPNVREALCFKTEDEEVGENFEAAAVLHETSDESQRALQAWFTGKVSPQRRPARWHFPAALPLNARGKPDRRRLKESLGR